jgi:sRNA-binding protein
MLPKEVIDPPKKAAKATAKPAARRASKPAAKAAARPAAAPAAAAPAKKAVGKIAHFYNKISVAVVDLKSELKVGDTISIEGASTNIKQKVASMQINNAPVQVAKAGQSIGLKVPDRVRDGDTVFKVSA